MGIITKNKRFMCIVLILVLLVIVGGFFYYQKSERWRHTFHVTFLNIGQGDSTLIQFANGETMLVDCGPNARVLSELGKALPLYVHTIDYVLTTHPDLDHYGGCVDVLRRYDVKHIVVNGREKQDAYYREWDKTMRAEPGADIIVMKAPLVWTIASSTLQFFSPDSSLTLDVSADDSNNYSIVFKLTAPTSTHSTGKEPHTFLFTGDMEVPLEEAIRATYCSVTSTLCPTLRSDILKVGHHGSNSSSGEDFLAAVKPDVAIISVGPNKYGHPSLRVLKHLERVGATIVRTDELGTIVK